MSYEVSVVLCTINERDSLEKIFDALERSATFTYEIIVVDDGSTDGTKELIVDYSNKHTNCKYIFHDSKSSLLIADYVGIKNADGKFIIKMDADMQHPPEKIKDIFNKLLDGYDIVVASRYADGGSTGNRKAIRGLISRVAEFLARILIRNANLTTDPLSGFFGFRRGLNLNIDEKWRGHKTLLFLLASNPGVVVSEIPYRFNERSVGESKIVNGLDFIISYMRELILVKKVEMKSRKVQILQRKQ
ncbi:MAG: glycosyltransferase [Nitrososphaerota archaeon]